MQEEQKRSPHISKLFQTSLFYRLSTQAPRLPAGGVLPSCPSRSASCARGIHREPLGRIPDPQGDGEKRAYSKLDGRWLPEFQSKSYLVNSHQHSTLFGFPAEPVIERCDPCVIVRMQYLSASINLGNKKILLNYF